MEDPLGDWKPEGGADMAMMLGVFEQSKRDMIAASILKSLIETAGLIEDEESEEANFLDPAEAADLAVQYTDALLARLKRK